MVAPITFFLKTNKYGWGPPGMWYTLVFMYVSVFFVLFQYFWYKEKNKNQDKIVPAFYSLYMQYRNS